MKIPDFDAHVLHKMLLRMKSEVGSDFSGIGVIIAESLAELPVVPLRPSLAVPAPVWLETYLAEISVETHDLHDGFHVISPEFNLLAVSQYFSPPIVPSLVIDPARRPGGRFMAGLFGSCLPGVTMTGVVGRKGDLSIFKRGRVILAGGPK